jgi:hypothetical protein
VLKDKNAIVFLLAVQFHGDPIREDDGILVFIIFAKEMVFKLEQIGFSLNIVIRQITNMELLEAINLYLP